MTHSGLSRHNAHVNRASDYYYDLPPGLIAQSPTARGASRLLVLDRATGGLELREFGDLPKLLAPGDALVINDTRVSARRLRGERSGGRPIEALLLRRSGEREWEALTYPGRKLRPGDVVSLDADDLGRVEATIVGTTPEGGRVLRFADPATRDALMTRGAAPLPPYIGEPLADEDRYQTVYAAHDGSAAAPTAGLHLTKEMLASVAKLGVDIVRVTLHVGVDTFRPVKAENLDEHVMHGEWYSIGEEAAARLNLRRGRTIAVGTTTVRALESAADPSGHVRSGAGVTRLFIRPGYRFRAVDAMLTNFHLPRSTLLMLVSAFAGYESIMDAYRLAVAERLRFYSFGDAMLIV